MKKVESAVVVVVVGGEGVEKKRVEEVGHHGEEARSSVPFDEMVVEEGTIPMVVDSP